jgi:hypothetical protein
VKKWLKQSGGVAGSSTVAGPVPVGPSGATEGGSIEVDGIARKSA